MPLRSAVEDEAGGDSEHAHADDHEEQAAPLRVIC